MEYLNDVIATTKRPTTLYHDDMFNQEVFVLLNHKPEFITSYDYREFNGITIEKMAEVLGKYKSKVMQAELDYYRDTKDLK